MKSALIIYSLLTAAMVDSMAQTNGISPELREKMKEAETRMLFRATNACPIHTELFVWRGENKCQVSYRGHTNLVVYVPIPEQEFDARLFTVSGQEVPKTHDCKFGQNLQPDKALLAGVSYIMEGISGYDRRMDFSNVNESHFWNIDLLKSFQIKKSGVYCLQVQVRLFTKDTNGVFQPFLLPPVETKVDISERDLGK
jgi:hypothetical protein